MIGLDDMTIAPYDKGIVIEKDNGMVFMAMPETIIKTSVEHEDMMNYLSRTEVL